MSRETVAAGALTRIHTSVLASRERELLTYIVARLPLWVTPDQLTLLGVVGGAMVGLGCVLANVDLNWLWLAVAGLVVNWFGDSTDGSLARYRRIERPRYGFFVDQFSDVVAHFFMLIGLGLSPLMRLDTALLALLGSLATMFYGHLKLQFSRTWQVSHHGVGPTELRIVIAIGFLAAIFGVETPGLPISGAVFTIFDFVGTLVFAGTMVVIAMMFATDRAKLALIDPPRSVIPPEVIVKPLKISGAEWTDGKSEPFKQVA